MSDAAVAVTSAVVASGCVLLVLWAYRARRPGPPPERPTEALPDLLTQHGVEVRHQLDRVVDLVMGLQERQAEQHGEVRQRLADTARATAGLADTTQALRQALANPKARGQWGERMAEDVLRLAGLVEGVSYRKQTALPGGTIPDFTFLMPGNLLLNMDVKFPVDNYLRLLEATTAAERAAAEQAFLRDVRARVRELAGRGYVVPGVTVDHVLLFIPNEAVYGFVLERDPQLADLALGQKVVLCSPFTLFAVVGVIRQAVDAFALSQASDEILDTLGSFMAQWERFSESLDTVTKRFDTAQRGLEELAGPRRRQLERQLDRIDDLRHRPGLARGHEERAGPRPLPVDRAG